MTWRCCGPVTYNYNNVPVMDSANSHDSDESDGPDPARTIEATEEYLAETYAKAPFPLTAHKQCQGCWDSSTEEHTIRCDWCGETFPIENVRLPPDYGVYCPECDKKSKETT